jgi:hypothetical protein
VEAPQKFDLPLPLHSLKIGQKLLVARIASPRAKHIVAWGQLQNLFSPSAMLISSRERVPSHPKSAHLENDDLRFEHGSVTASVFFPLWKGCSEFH